MNNFPQLSVIQNTRDSIGKVYKQLSQNLMSCISLKSSVSYFDCSFVLLVFQSATSKD